MTTQKLRKIASEIGKPAIIKALKKKAALMSKDKGKERATELVEEWIADASKDQLIEVVGDHNYADAVELSRLPLQVRGYGHVKQRSAKAIEARHADLITRVHAPGVKARAVG